MNTLDRLVSRIKGNAAQSTKATGRDSLLDFSKGVAIFLVVLGHTLQGQAENFDALQGFRFIYAFHMPLFAFLSGAAASHWIEKFEPGSNMKALFHASWSRIQRSAAQLLLPFASWTFVAFWVRSANVPLVPYLQEVFRHTDRSLWFLPCIFWCTAYTSIFMFAVTALRRMLNGTTHIRSSRYLALLPVQMTVLYVVWRCVRSRLPGHFGLAFANGFHGGLFFYYLLGVVVFRPFARLENGIVRLLPYLLFFALVPYWHRTLPHNLLQDAPAWLGIGWNYAGWVAIAGTLAVVDLSRIFHGISIKSVNGPVTFLGSASSGVYAMHFYFLGYQPQVIAAILISLLLYQLGSITPIARTVLFGK